jgi:predicted phage baseplate assembly protein
MSASVSNNASQPSLQTPLPIFNRPGLAAIAYRCGVHAAFKQSMLTRLATLRGLHTHEDGDFTVAFIDAVASMAEILSFYQERIANESYLRTAIERRSLVELGRLIGYEPRPGVAASAFLAFTMESAPGAPDQAAPPITIGMRQKAQSLPGPGEQPQTFETIETIAARPEWNAIAPRLTQPQPISTTMPSVFVNGTSVGVQPGDNILIAADTQAVERVVAVTPDTARGTTRIDLVSDPPDPPPFSFPIYPVGIFFTEPVFLDDAVVSNQLFGFGWRQHDLVALARVQNWSFSELRLNFQTQAAHRALPPEQGVFTFGQKAAVFGHNAPRWSSLPAAQQETDVYPNGWEGVTLSQQISNPNVDVSSREIDLDRVYSGITIGSAVILESQTDVRTYRVEEVFETSRADFTLSGKLTRLRLDSDDGFDTFTVRGTTVYLQSQPLDLADLPIVDPVEGISVILDGAYLELAVGQSVILTGTRADLAGVVASEAMTIADIAFIDGYTTLTFQQALTNSYVRSTVTINANVALATHGETVQEVLGSGDASQTFQSFTLRQPPLTYVSSDDPSGAASTLQVSVNNVQWEEAPAFFGHAPGDRVYVARTGDDGVTTVEFGDGIAGARPATGTENITAVYRKGMGSAGNVDAGKIMLLPVRPLGVRSVTNPLPASGATDPEQAGDIRRNAALNILTLDRIVSLQDYENFARAFAGVAKALATWSWIGRTRGVFVTVAGANGADLPPTGQTYVNLLAAMRKAGDPNVPLRVQTYRNAFFRLAATVTTDPAYAIDAVLTAVESTLRAAFSFDARDFGQPVALSEVLAAIQSVSGVRAAQVTQFFRTDDPNAGGLGSVLTAAVPLSGSAGEPLAAELLTLDPRPLDLVGVSA